MKKTFKLLTAALGVFCLASCGENVSKTNEKVFPGSGYTDGDYVGIKDLNLYVGLGQTQQIDLDGMPKEYLKTIKFKSNNADVISVSETGEVTGLKRGIGTITVSHADGKKIGNVNVFVSDGTNKDVDSTLSYLKSKYSDPSYSRPTKVHQEEYSYEIYTKGGNVDHSVISYEEIYFDEEDAYFMVGGDDLYTYTSTGARELNGGTWIFDVQGMKTRMFHITDNERNYFQFNSAKYLNDVDAIYDILDMFFVSGRGIIDNLLDSYSGKDDFEYYSKGYPGDNINVYADGNNNAFMELNFYNPEEVVDTESELKYVDMYEGTVYAETDYVSYIYNGASCSGFDINVIYDYEENGIKCQRQFMRSQLYDEDYEPIKYEESDEDLKLAGWSLVTSLYEL